jgi:hypothetical protein
MKKFTGIFFCITLLFSCNKNNINTGNNFVNVPANAQNIYEDVDITNFYKVVYNGNIEYIKKYIEEIDDYSALHEHRFSNNDLRILRNTIYAMHGYKFKSKDLQEHFEKFSWYKGTKENIDNELSEKELMLIRVISAMEAANPPSRNDMVGLWKIPVPSSVESLGFLELYLGEDGTAEIAAGDEIRIDGFWSLDGAHFSMKPAEGVESLDYFGFPWFDGVENLRITVFEYKGKLYKACNIFGQSPRDCYQSNNLPPIEYFGY